MDQALSDAFSGVLVSDFYAAYHHYDGPKQRCWAHPCSSQGQALLRDIHDQRTRYPDAAPLDRWADAVHGIYDRAKAFTHPRAKRRRTAQLARERQLLALGQPFRHDPSAVQGKLCRRIERHLKSLPRTGSGELFVFVAEPAVPSDNNAAERSLRHLVVSRKVSGGTRSERGTLGAGHRAQDDAGIPLRRLARPRTKSARRLPSAARFPSTLNCYVLSTPLTPSEEYENARRATLPSARPLDSSLRSE